MGIGDVSVKRYQRANCDDDTNRRNTSYDYLRSKVRPFVNPTLFIIDGLNFTCGASKLYDERHLVFGFILFFGCWFLMLAVAAFSAPFLVHESVSRFVVARFSSASPDSLVES